MIFSIRTWKTDPFLLKLYFSYPKRWQRCALPSSEKVPFHIVVLFKHRYQVWLQAPSGLSSRLFISVRPSKHLESRAVYGLGILMYVTNRNVVLIRLRLRHPIFIRICVYPYAFMHICVINIQNMALSTSHEGNSLCVYLPSELKIATLCDWKSRIRMRKCTHIRAYRSVPYTFFIFVSYTHLG